MEINVQLIYSIVSNRYINKEKKLLNWAHKEIKIMKKKLGRRYWHRLDP
jgi:hypothetical protein